jgi:hypothetical protein
MEFLEKDWSRVTKMSPPASNVPVLSFAPPIASSSGYLPAGFYTRVRDGVETTEEVVLSPGIDHEIESSTNAYGAR